MTRRRKKKKQPHFDPTKRVRRLARAVLGTPPGVRVAPSDRRKSKLKHKKRELEAEWD